MGHSIRILVGELELSGTLNESPTAAAIWGELPLERTVNTWGDEFYFDIGVAAELEPGASDLVEVGDLGYWPPGQAFCIFFGRTPVSRGEEARAASPVNVIGRLDEVPVEALRGIPNGAPVRIERDE